MKKTLFSGFVIAAIGCSRIPPNTRDAQMLEVALQPGMIVPEVQAALEIPPDTPTTFVGSLGGGFSSFRSPRYPGVVVVARFEPNNGEMLLRSWSVEKSDGTP